MSRGPGRVQRAIEAAFRASPQAAFAVEELAALAYPGTGQIAKRHRVAVLRAADAAAGRMGLVAAALAKPGNPLVYFRPCGFNRGPCQGNAVSSGRGL
jgi:hypothetical protein